jgi:prepilin-type N-terminal cleavage/methylation domain-containing protein/prepilin-type processing-associated H-X9-DG protein
MARPRTSRGFTLVELLVVITIIGMLVSLLLPAIQAAREAGRRNTCQSNMRQAAFGLIQFAEVKRAFPGYVNVVPKQNYAPGFIRTSWVVPILPALERNDLYDNWQSPLVVPLLNPDPTIGNRNLFVSPLSILVCPSNPVPDLGDNALSYVVNTGLAFTANHTSTQDSGGSEVPTGANYPLQAEDVNSGVFFNHSQWDGNQMSAGTTTPVGFAGGRKVNADFISTNDGTTYTMMMSENLQAVNWATDRTAPTESLWINDLTVRGHTGMVWFITGLIDNNGPAPANPGYAESAIGINEAAEMVTPGTYQLLYGPEMGTDIYVHGGLAFARPSSNHTSGVNAAFCDGHMRYIADDIEYKVYTQLMTPNQKVVNVTPNSTPTTAFNSNWRYILDESAF